MRSEANYKCFYCDQIKFCGISSSLPLGTAHPRSRGLVVVQGKAPFPFRTSAEHMIGEDGCGEVKLDGTRSDTIKTSKTKHCIVLSPGNIPISITADGLELDIAGFPIKVFAPPAVRPVPKHFNVSAAHLAALVFSA